VSESPKRRPFWALPGLPQLIMLAAILLVNHLNSPQFFHVTVKDGRLFGSVVDVLYRGAPVAILALGMTPVIATGGIDLSVGAVIAIAGAVAAFLAQTDLAGWQIISLALMTGLACGLWNGLLVAKIGVQPFVATLILMVSGRGVAQMITEGRILTFNNPGVDFISRSSLLTVPTAIIIMLGALGLGTLLLRGTALGLMVEATGINRAAAALAGVRTSMVLAASYAWCGLCASIAGLIIVSDIRGADANNAGLWLEMDAILAVVIGGTSLLGGRFSLGFSVVGALIIQAMNTGILLSGFKPELNYIVKALVVLAVLCAQSPALKTALAKVGKGRASA
jgi:simple sugar transport system permease protein